MKLSPNKKIYFASDQHFGFPNPTESRLREQHFVDWLDTIKTDAEVLFLLGDLFDFWFEYQKVVPKYFVRVLGKLAELSDSGIRILFFVGNHDMWMLDYLQQELNATVYFEPQRFTFNGQRFFIGHGDGLGPGDASYKRLKKVFRFPLFNWLFRWLHPDFGIRLGEYFSRNNKLLSGDDTLNFKGDAEEWLVCFCQEQLQKEAIDYFVFGHRHLPLNIALNTQSRYLNTGDWVRHNSYAMFDGQTLHLDYFTKPIGPTLL